MEHENLNGPEDVQTALTERETEVVRALMDGIGVWASAKRLGITVETMRTHIKHIHCKTATHSLDELVAWGYHHLDT